MTDLVDDHVYVAWQWYDYGHEVFSGRLYDGSWGEIETIDDVLDEHGSYFDLSSWGNDVWAVWCDTDSYSKVKRRSYTTGNWSAATNVFYGDRPVRLPRGDENGTLYLLWDTLSDVRYKYYDGSNWESTYHILCSETSIISSDSFSTSRGPEEGIISVVYSISDYINNGPYSIVHCNLFLYDESNNIDTSTTLYDENGNKIVKYYDGLGRLRKVERYTGSGLYSSENYRYNWQGLKDSYTTPSGNEYVYKYDVLGQSTKVINPDETYSQTVYNYADNTREVLDEEGRKRKYTYDWMDRLTEVKEYNTTTNYYHTQYEYDEVSNLVKITDSKGRNTTYQYDQLNRLTQVSYPDETYETISYDAAGNIVEERSRNATYTEYQYDSLDRLLNTTYYTSSSSSSPSGNWLSGWNYRKEVTISGSTAGSQTDYQIRLEVHYGSGADSPPDIYCNSHCQTDFDDIIFTKADGSTLLHYWIESKINNDSAVIWVEVDEIPASPNTVNIYIYYGNPNSLTNSNFDATFPILSDDFEDGTLGEIPSGWYKYGGTASDTIQVQNDQAYAGSKSMKVHENSGDATNCDVRTNDLNGASDICIDMRFRITGSSEKRFKTFYLNEASSTVNLIATIIGRTHFRYKDGGYKDIPNSPSPQANTWYHHQAYFKSGTGKWKAVIDGNDSGWLNTLNSWNTMDYVRVCGNYNYGTNCWIDQIFIRKWADPEPYITDIGAETEEGSIILTRIASAVYSYDATGNKISSEWNGTCITWSYDARNRLISENFNVSGQVYSLGYGYDNASNLVSMTYPDDGYLGIQYDALNRVSQLGSLAAFSYTLDDRVDTINYENGVVTSYDYDSRNRPTDIVVEKGANKLLDLDYGYDDSGSVTSIYSGACNETYSYDLLDRLTGSTGPWGTVGYSYDSVGNRLTRTQGGTTSYAYDCMDRLTSATGMGFGWDLNGNMVYMDDGTYEWNYTYDRRGGLVVVKRDGSPFGRYWYDADGRRVKMQEGGNTLVHVYSGLDVVYEVNGSGTTRHFYANGLHVAENRSGAVEYFHQDHLWSTRLKTNSTGGVVYDTNYQPFGPTHGESGSEDFKYTGKHEDSTGLYYFGARYYDPETGRFITEDLVIGRLSDPQSLNRYVYCRNNPYKYIDLDGQIPIIAGALIGGGVNFAFYYMTHRNNNFKWSEAIATTAAGLVTGAITCGVGNYIRSLAFTERVVIIYVSNEIASSAGTSAEMTVNEIIGDPSRGEHLETIVGGGVEAIVDPTVETTFEIINEVTGIIGITGYALLDEVIEETISTAFVWSITHPDQWINQEWLYYESSTSSSSSEIMIEDELVL